MVRVVVIGGGFAGLNLIRALKKEEVEITLLDRTNHHLFQPLLYQVATAALSQSNIASPLREILKGQANVEVLMEEVVSIDKQANAVKTKEDKAYGFDFLVVAVGSQHSYFGRNDWEKHAPGLKTLTDAEKICQNILIAFERAERCEDPQEAKKFLSFAIVGGGPTGVEMAGSIAEFAKRTLFKNFRRINPADSKIYLIEGTSELLPSFPHHLSQKTTHYLQELGVEVLTEKKVTDIQEGGVFLDGEFLAAATVIWAAGNQASPLLKTLETPLDRQGRALVNPDLSIPQFPHIFVIGDAACLLDEKNIALPSLAPVAIQQGHYVASIIKKRASFEPRAPFVYFDKGSIATVGGGKAVATVGKWQFSGLFAWLVWACIHIAYLISFRNRLLIMIQWIFLYLLGRRQSRIILRSIDDSIALMFFCGCVQSFW